MSVPSQDTPSSAHSAKDRGFFGHPAGLGWLFQVEMWERFSYYGMRAILLYFLVDTVSRGGLGLPESTGQAVVATYGAAVYLLAIPGGFIADRVTGPWRATLWGGVIIMSGHICLSLPTVPTAWLGICLVALGTGFIKPNLSTMVGELYDEEDPRRDAGFQIFYMSINLGSFFSPLVVAFLRSQWGYHAGFAAAAVGMAAALTAFLIGRKALHGIGSQVPAPLSAQGRRRLGWVSLGILAGAGLLFGLFLMLEGDFPAAIVDTVATISILASVGYFTAMLRSPRVTANERSHVKAYIPLWFGAMLFFMIFEQAAGKMATFAASNTQLDLGSVSIDPSLYQSINPLGIVLLAPLIGAFFTARAGRFPNTAAKFAFAVLLIGISALAMGGAFATWPGGTSLAPFYVLALVFVLQTIAELFLSPVGLSATTMLAPKAFASQAMALWFLATAAGQGVAALTIKATANLSDATFYYVLGGVTLVCAAGLFALVPWTQRKMADIEEMKRRAADGARTVA